MIGRHSDILCRAQCDLRCRGTDEGIFRFHEIARSRRLGVDALEKLRKALDGTIRDVLVSFLESYLLGGHKM